MYQRPPPHQQGPPPRPRPPMQALDLAGPPLQAPRRRPGADEYVALVSPIYDKRFEEQMDDRRPFPQENPLPTNRMPPPLRNGPPGEAMPTMQFSFGDGGAGIAPPPRTKSAPPDEPRNWDRNAPPLPHLDRDQFDDRRGHYAPNMPLTKRGRGPPPRGGGRPSMDGRPPMDRHPPQQLYDRGPEPRRRSPPQGPYDGRGPPSRSNTFPVPNDGYDPRGQPPPPHPYDQGPRGPPRTDERGYPVDPRRDPRTGNVDQMLDNYIEELGSPRQQYASPPRPGDPRMGGPPRPDPRFNNPRSLPFSEPAVPQERYIPPDRRQLAAQAGHPGPPRPGSLQRSQTAPEMNDFDTGVQKIDFRRLSPPGPQSRTPNKLHKSSGKTSGPVGVQSQVITNTSGTEIDPNALPIFPSPEQKGPTPQQAPNVPPPDRASYSSEGSYRGPPRVMETPRLTLALLENYKRDAKDNPHDPAIQLDYAKALLEASTALSQEIGMGDPKRVAKSRENFISEAYKLVKKLSSSVDCPGDVSADG